MKTFNQSSLDALLAEVRTHGEVEDLYPATPLQAGLLFHALHSPSSDQYSVQMQWTYEGALNAEALKRAWQEVIAQHAILRTGFNWSQGDQMIQVVYRSLPLDWESIDLSELSAAEQATQVELIQQADRASGFSLDHPPLLRFKLLRLQADRHVFLFNHHHILLDGWSNPILFKQVEETYEHLNQGKGVPYYPIVPYSSYISWLKKQDQALAQGYWQGQLSGIEQATDIGICRTNIHLDSNKSIEELGNLTHVYSQVETGMLQTFVQSKQVTLNTLVQLAWGRLLHTYSGGDDQTVHGMVVSGRSHALAGMDQLVGLLINTLPVVLDWGEEVSIAAQLKRLHEQVQQINHYSYVSLAEVQKYAKLAGGSLFHSLVVFENFPLESMDKGSVIVSGMQSFQKTNYPLTLTAYVTGGELHLEIGYDRAVFEVGSIERLMVHLRSLLIGFMVDAEASPQGVSLLSLDEYEEIVYGWNKTAVPYPQDKTVHGLFEEQVSKAPEKVALVFEGEELTYGELNGRANQLARAIQKAYQGQTGESLKPDTLIGICVERSLDMVIGILGILKSGGGYVPIDPAYPAERIQYMLSDTSAQVLLTQSNLGHVQSVAAQMPGHISMLYLDQGACYSEESASNLSPVSGSHDLAYVIYTSGSTGKPKGVMVEHHSVVRLVKGQDYIDFENRVFAQAANIAFDATTFEVWAPLLSNAQLVIVKHAQVLEASLLSKQIQEYHVDTLWLTASLFDQLVSYNVDTLHPIKQLLVGGDIVSLASCRKLLVANPGCQLVNGYGPTEGTVFSTTYLINSYHEPQGPIPIGSGLHNTTLYVLDTRHQPVPLGVSGELYIGGDGVARGYLNQEELNQERFIANPFASQEDKTQGRNLRLYKSGDLVKWLPDGNLVYLGRSDFQVKLRGYRIELGEIEIVLSGYAGIAQCVVVMQEDKEQDQKHLVAYYVLDAGTAAVTPDAFRSYLQTKLPEYMVPTFFVQLEALPLTVNGKIDRKALPEPDVSGQISQGYVAPRTETEHKLCEVWQTVLGLEQIGVQDNFFHIGGDSILSIQVVSKARDIGLSLQVQDIFAAPTIAQLAMRVEPLTASQADQGLVQGLCPLLPIQQWFFDEQYEYSHHWNQAQLLKVHDRIDLDQLHAALEQLVAQHDSLRLRYRQRETESIEQYYSDDATSTYCLEVLDLVDIPNSRQASQIANWGTFLQDQLNYETGPVMAVGLVRGHVDGSDRLLLAIHHLMVDGVSWRILLPDLQALYSGGILPSKTHSYQAWSNALLAYAQEKSVTEEGLAYWRSVEEKLLAVQLPYKPGANLSQPTRGRKVFDLVLDSALTDQLLHKTSHAYNTQINDLLLTAFALALGSLTEANASERLVGFCLEGHGREQIDASLDLSRTVGWFTSLYPVSLSLPATADLHQLIPSIKEQLRAIPDKGLSYGVLAYLHPDEGVRAQLHPDQLPRVSFNYLGQFDQSLRQTLGWQLTGESSGDAVDKRNHLSNHLDVNGLVLDNQLHFTLAYSTAHFAAETIRALQEQFERQLKEIVNHCAQRKECYATPSDYPLVALSQSSLDTLLAEVRTHGEVEELYPASPLQAGLLFHALHSPSSDQYSVQVQWTYEGALDAEALKCAWQEVIGQHAILRTGFNWSQGEVLQVVYRSLPLDWESIDLSELSAEEQATQVGLIQQADLASGFSLDHPPLLRFKLLKLQADRHVFFFHNHHILLDGWSNPILFKQVHETYEHLNQGRGVPYYPIVPYSSYITWLKEQDQELAQSYWQGQLSGIERATDIGIRRANVQLDSNKPIEELENLTHVYSAKETDQLQKFVQGQQVTLNTLVQLAWGRLLHTYSGGDDRTVHGMVISGRSHALAGMDQLVGLLINTLPVVLNWGEEVSIAGQLKRLHEQVQQINHYSYVSLSEVQQCAKLVGGSLFHSLVVFENYPLESMDKGSVSMSGMQYFQKTHYPLTLIAYVTGGELHLEIGYDRALFEGGSIERLLVHLSDLLVGFMADAEASPQGVSLLTADEYQQIVYGWNQTSASYPQDKTVHELFADQVVRTPDNVALVFEGEELTYGELNGRANQLARAIQKVYQGQTGESLRADTLIGISVEASLDMVIGILGILKSGGGYVPIDPGYPAERIQYMLSDTRAQVLLTQSNLSHVQSVAAQMPGPINMLYLDQGACYAEEEASNLSPVSGTHDLAYVIYTSGSTGNPKGVMVEHHSVVNRLYWMQHTYQFDEKDRVLQKTPYGFDVSVWEVLLPLLSGSQLVVSAPGVYRDPQALIEKINCYRVTKLHFVPSMLAVFMEAMLKTDEQLLSLPMIFCSGEALPFQLITKIKSRYPAISIHNQYGPTETGEVICCNDIRLSDEIIPIGRPLWNITAYILDTNRQPVPLGVPGELYIGGDGVARGYLNQEELTRERFIANPFAGQEDKSQGRNLRLYKTGDLVKWLPDGNLVYLGRTDFQVKLRGYRIELGEIEALLSGYGGIAQCVVLMHEAKEEKYLVAYYVLDAGTDEVATEVLRSYLQARLPDYMVPSFFVQLEKLPLTVNGKVDRRALPEPDVRGQISQGYVAPRTETEHKLCEVWQKVLGLDQIGVQNNFFHIGGHSLVAVQLVSRLNQALHLNLPVSWVFTYQNIAAQAEAIAHRVAYNQAIVVYNQQEGDSPLFLFHPDLAGAEVYYEMAQLLQKHHIPVYGVNSYNIAHPEHPIESFDQLTAYYAQEITKIYSGKRLFLGGWSLGGVLSYGVYHHLLKQGKEVDCIFMLDTRSSYAGLNELMAQVDLKALALKFMPEQVVSKLYQHLEGAEYIAKITRASAIHLNMLQHFKPQGRVNKIVLFKASESNFDASAWKQWAAQLDIIGIESDHHTIMKRDNLQPIVKHMTEVIRQQLAASS